MQDAELSFNLAARQSDEPTFVAIVHSLIDCDVIDIAARLCLQAASIIGRTDQISELVYEIRRAIVSVGASNEQLTYAKAPSTAVLAIEASGYTALHAAAASHLFFVVELFLLYAQIDPSTQAPNNLKRPIDLIGDLSDEEAQNEDVKRILFLLDRCTKKREFQLRTTAVLSADVVTREAVDGLLSNMTDIKDLQVILALGVSNLDAISFKQLTIQAFQYMISNKLVFDDGAAVYFRMGLKQCFDKGYISETELEYWRLQMSKVNMESAPWVSELKETIHNMQTQIVTLETNAQLLKKQFHNLRQALINKELQQQRKARIKSVLAIVSIGVDSACGGPMLTGTIEGFIDFADPVQLLSAVLDIDESDIVEFCTETASSLAIGSRLETALTQAGIEPLDFAAVLKDAVIFKHPEYATRSNDVAVTSSQFQEIDLSSALSVDTQVESLSSEDDELTYEREDTRTGTNGPTKQDYERQQLASFPYHYAIQPCEGDFKEFLELLEIADEEARDVNNACEVIVPLESASKFEARTLAPYEFASYVGYVDVIKHLRARPDFDATVGSEPMIQTLNRARKISKVAQAV